MRARSITGDSLPDSDLGAADAFPVAVSILPSVSSPPFFLSREIRLPPFSKNEFFFFFQSDNCQFLDSPSLLCTRAQSNSDYVHVVAVSKPKRNDSGGRRGGNERGSE